MAELFIGQLPFSKFFPEDLLNLFRPYGNVVAHQLHIRQGNAFVTYAATDEADAAISALHGQCSLGTRSQPIQVMYSKGTRLISAFGLQHRSLCLARNKDRQRNKETLSATSNSSINNESVSLNDAVLAGLSGELKDEPATGLYPTGAEEVGANGNRSGAGVASFVSYGPIDISFDDEGRQMMGSGIFSNPSMYSLNAAATRQVQQQQAYVSGLMSVDPMVYGTPMKWAMTPPTMLMPTSNGSSNNSSNNGVLSPPSQMASPAAPPLPPPALSYVVMSSSTPTMATGFGVPGRMPVCYVVPTPTSPAYLSQQMLPPSLAYMQMQPM
ncbi:hypothetical protein ABB37_04538 [Leptomonas pyrrhocoris]|uniref:RRM domain-containing protein n=1 Tax=Leptomonas pyrrhocoris TaxID=157538 RepID=A0A0N1J4X0_LEPPY|nr:hypothetical protein ABB37_04538 [Leptomonas pyrrhocoris]KPA81201.1 hypothetical protein ABB37_04538 [Leptomonas pyrrhocoris]|eukprot:XP_015659640.1 hypothetical protein ABB37_04538 [Leptomonas pyrrhocoris]